MRAIRELRLKAGLSQAAVARAAGLTVTQIFRIEAGHQRKGGRRGRDLRDIEAAILKALRQESDRARELAAVLERRSDAIASEIELGINA